MDEHALHFVALTTGNTMIQTDNSLVQSFRKQPIKIQMQQKGKLTSVKCVTRTVFLFLNLS